MKARLKNDIKVIVDVLPYYTNKTYIDVNSGRIYDADEIVLIEYYGG